MLCGCTFGPRPAGRRPRRPGHRRPEQFHAPHRPLLRHAATARRRALGLSFHRRQLPPGRIPPQRSRQRIHALFRRPGRTTGTAPLLRHPSRTGETLPAPHLRLEPCDIERLFQIQRLAPCIASTFLFRIGGEEVRCTLRRIEGYDPSAASTRCTFTRLPNG